MDSELLKWLIVVSACIFPFCASSLNVGVGHYEFGPFKDAVDDNLVLIPPARIQNNVLELIPSFVPHQSSRAMLNESFELWNRTRAASFNSTFNVVTSWSNTTSAGVGEGVSFLIGPTTTGGLYIDHLLIVVINIQRGLSGEDEGQASLRTNSSYVAKPFKMPAGTRSFTVWVEYNATLLDLQVRIAASVTSEQYSPRPPKPVLKVKIDTKTIVSRDSYLGFSASTGDVVAQTYSISKWSVSVEVLKEVVPIAYMFGMFLTIAVIWLLLATILQAIYMPHCLSGGSEVLEKGKEE